MNLHLISVGILLFVTNKSVPNRPRCPFFVVALFKPFIVLFPSVIHLVSVRSFWFCLIKSPKAFPTSPASPFGAVPPRSGQYFKRVSQLFLRETLYRPVAIANGLRCTCLITDHGRIQFYGNVAYSDFICPRASRGFFRHPAKFDISLTVFVFLEHWSTLRFEESLCPLIRNGADREVLKPEAIGTVSFSE